MYREQNYIFSFTFVYKPKMASLIKITKKEKKKTHGIVNPKKWMLKSLSYENTEIRMQTLQPSSRKKQTKHKKRGRREKKSLQQMDEMFCNKTSHCF